MKIPLLALVAAVSLTLPFAVSAAEPAGQLVVFHTPGPNWPKEGNVGFDNPEIQKHGQYWGQLTEFVEKGGPMSTGGGMMLLKPGITEAKAKELAYADPACKDGFFLAEVRFWNIKIDNTPATTPSKAVPKNGFPFVIGKVDAAYIHTTKNSGLAKWYQETLGLEAGWGDSTWQQFSLPLPSSTFAIDFLKGMSPVSNQPVILSFQVSDIHAAVKYMQTKGVKFLLPLNPIEVRPWGLLASFQDSDGNWMQLNEDKK